MKRWNVIVELPTQRDIAEAHLWLAELARLPKHKLGMKIFSGGGLRNY